MSTEKSRFRVYISSSVVDLLLRKKQQQNLQLTTTYSIIS